MNLFPIYITQSLRLNVWEHRFGFGGMITNGSIQINLGWVGFAIEWAIGECDCPHCTADREQAAELERFAQTRNRVEAKVVDTKREGDR